MDAWNLESVKVGDKVLISTTGWHRRLEIGIVDKVGKVHITVGSSKYQIRGGRECGERWHARYARLYSETEWQEYLTEQRERKMRNEVNDFNWRECDIALIRTVHALLPKKEEKSA